MQAPNPTAVFDRKILRLRRARAAITAPAHPLLAESGVALAERLGDVKRDFATALDFSPFANDELTAALAAKGAADVTRHDLITDDEVLPFAPASFDLAVGNLALHNINDLVGAMIQIRHALKPGGLFLASMFGGQTLADLRQCLMEAELSITGGASPRVAPVASLRDMSGLLQRAGFTLPVADQENFTLVYPDLTALMHDLRNMGEGNIQTHRLPHFSRRDVFAEAARLYRSRHAHPDGGITATFEIFYLHGWQTD